MFACKINWQELVQRLLTELRIPLGPLLEYRDEEGRSCLSTACEHQNEGLLKILLNTVWPDARAKQKVKFAANHFFCLVLMFVVRQELAKALFSVCRINQLNLAFVLTEHIADEVVFTTLGEVSSECVCLLSDCHLVVTGGQECADVSERSEPLCAVRSAL